MNISALVLTYNEEPNIERLLDSISWIDEVVVLDSFSNDRTLEIVSNYSNVKVVQREFDNHTNQWNYGLSIMQGDWVITLDADYIVPGDLKQELLNLSLSVEVNGYFIKFKYCINGEVLSSGILPPRLMLFDKSYGSYVQDGHTQMLELNGVAETLNCSILHDDRKELSRWLWAQEKYMMLEYKKMCSADSISLSLQDKIRKKKYFAPFLVLIYCLILKGGIFDGKRGVFYAFQRCFAEFVLSLKLLEKDIYADKP